MTLMAGCGTNSDRSVVADTGSSRNKVTGVVWATGLEALPPATLRNWRDYADQVAVVRVTGEHEQPPTDEQVKIGEYGINRTVDVEVEQAVWSRIPPVDRFTQDADGWTYSKKNGRREIRTRHAERLTPGETYLVGLTRSEQGEWGPMEAMSVLPLAVDGTVSGGTIKEIVGETPDQVGMRLSALAPDPVVEKYADYAAIRRYGLVYAEKTGDTAASSEGAPTTTTP